MSHETVRLDFPMTDLMSRRDLAFQLHEFHDLMLDGGAFTEIGFMKTGKGRTASTPVGTGKALR